MMYACDNQIVGAAVILEMYFLQKQQNSTIVKWVCMHFLVLSLFGYIF